MNFDSFIGTLTSHHAVGIYWFLMAFYFLQQPFKWAGVPLSRTHLVSEYMLDINVTINMFVVCGFYGSMYTLGIWR